jgi:ribosomal protein S18 acetylase RimI-like enzyme
VRGCEWRSKKAGACTSPKTEYQGNSLGRRLLAFTRLQLPDEIWLRCVRENEKAWRWYEREGFLLEKE